MKKNIVFFIVILVVFVSLALAACNGGGGTITDVSVQLKWLHTVQFAGHYVAAEEGYYVDEGLNVTIEPIDFDSIAGIEELVATGQNTFGITSADQVIIARSQGIPVKAVAVIFRINPLVMLAVDDVVVNKPADLVGKTVATHEGQADLIYRTMMENAGVDLSQITHVTPSSFNALECLQNADVCSAYSTDGVVEAVMKGHTTYVLWPDEYGVPFYADVIIASDEYIEQHPDMVAAFVSATLKGWQQAVENPSMAVDDTLKFDPNLDRDFQMESMKATIPLVDTGNIAIGLMEPEIWQTMYDILLDKGMLESAVNLEDVYTNEFVEGSK
ncbi:MAG TPA: hypothetical protein DEH25_15775 [Chloroflexi bacterium]|nr:hypothetical protein [Chloroflexota bacterium]HBY09045.1 hypothetical protein [Chloroflexota bacterium]